MLTPFSREEILAAQPEDKPIRSYKSEKKHDTPEDKLRDWKEWLLSEICTYTPQNLPWIQLIITLHGWTCPLSDFPTQKE